MTDKYICTECTGRTGNEHTFELGLDGEPSFCPYCGQDRPIKTIEEYLRAEIEELKTEIDRLAGE